MKELRVLVPPDVWLRQVFSSKAARDGGIVRRSLRDIDWMIGRENLELELHRRGYSAVTNAGQLVIFCNREPIRRFT